MKHIVSLTLLAIMTTSNALENTSPFEKRQIQPPCFGSLCELSTPLVLNGPVTFTTIITSHGLTIGLGSTEGYTTTIGDACCASATCIVPEPPTTVPTTITVHTTHPATFIVPIPPVHTSLTIIIPSAGFSGVLTVPPASVPDAGVRPQFNMFYKILI